jgi:large subunit ribosomal protein L29
MKAAPLREMTLEELKKKDDDLRRELFNLKFRLATGEVENPMRIRSLRRDRARVLTVLTEKLAIEGSAK